MDNTIVDTMIEAACAGGVIAKDYFGKSLEVLQKSTAADLRSDADTQSEEAILKVLQKAFPSYNIHSEEADYQDNHSEYTFAIDPLDGTNNFLLGIPNFTILIALLHKNEVVAGVVHCPIINDTYHAIKNEGAYLNKTKIMVNKESRLDHTTVGFSAGYDTPPEYRAKLMANLNALDIKRFMSNWSVAHDLCLLASGKIEVVINKGNQLYDLASGLLIASEAGATVTNFVGKASSDAVPTQFVASNGTEIHQSIITVMP